MEEKVKSKQSLDKHDEYLKKKFQNLFEVNIKKYGSKEASLLKCIITRKN